MTTFPKYKVAVVQASPEYCDLNATVNKVIRLIHEAAAAGAKLIAFPECFVPGYPFHSWLDSFEWTISSGWVTRYAQNALEYGSPQAKKIEEAVCEAGIAAVIGLTERKNGTLYIAQWILDHTGKTVATRRKLRVTAVERTVFGDGDGSDLAVHQLPGLGNVGALSCWEHIHPLNRFAMYSQNEQVHVGSWPSYSIYDRQAHQLSPEVFAAETRTYAVEGQCFFLSSCNVVSPAIIDTLCGSDPKKHELLHVGGGYSRIISPEGRDLVDMLPPDEEGILYADIDLSNIAIAKASADPVGHYSRPDAVRLLFNPTPARRVETFTGEFHDSSERDG